MLIGVGVRRREEREREGREETEEGNRSEREENEDPDSGPLRSEDEQFENGGL